MHVTPNICLIIIIYEKFTHGVWESLFLSIFELNNGKISWLKTKQTIDNRANEFNKEISWRKDSLDIFEKQKQAQAQLFAIHASTSTRLIVPYEQTQISIKTTMKRVSFLFHIYSHLRCFILFFLINGKTLS